MGLWPGNAYFGYRYDYATEYVSIIKELWTKGVSDFKGKHFTMTDCKLSPQPSHDIQIVAAGQSGRGMEFASQYADFNFALGAGINMPTKAKEQCERLVEANKTNGKDCGSYVLYMIIAEETDEEAQAKWKSYREGADVDALAWMAEQSGKDEKADANASATVMKLPEGAVNFNIGTFVGSYSTVAGMLDEAAALPGVKGLMLIFDDFLPGMDKFGQKIQPLMKCRAHVGANLA